MLLRNLPRIYRPFSCSEIHPSSSCQTLPSRRLHGNNSRNITEPPVNGGLSTISLAHPRDPGSSSRPPSTSPPPSGTPGPSDIHSHPPCSPPPPPPASPPPEPSEPERPAEQEIVNNVPVPANNPPPQSTSLPSPHQLPQYQYANPPFNTHKFFSELEKSFPSQTAHGLMRATRALLIDRIGRVKREALTVKDLESQAYLFKAAVAELRTEVTMRTRSSAAKMRTTTSALRREVDALENRMKEDLGALKHEIQMDLDNRKNEARNDLRRQDILNEELLNKSLIEIGELRTMMEEARWDNMRNSVAALSGFLLVIIISMELLVTKKTPPPPPPKPDITQPEGEGIQKMDWVT